MYENIKVHIEHDAKNIEIFVGHVVKILLLYLFMIMLLKM